MPFTLTKDMNVANAFLKRELSVPISTWINYEFEKAYAEAPGILLVAYLQGDYVGVSGLDGLDTTRVLGHHSVGVMWNIEDWTITK